MEALGRSRLLRAGSFRVRMDILDLVPPRPLELSMSMEQARHGQTAAIYMSVAARAGWPALGYCGLRMAARLTRAQRRSGLRVHWRSAPIQFSTALSPSTAARC